MRKGSLRAEAANGLGHAAPARYLGQVHFVVGKGAARKFTSGGRPQAGDAAKGFQRAGDDGHAAVHVQLNHILSARRGEEQRRAVGTSV